MPPESCDISTSFEYQRRLKLVSKGNVSNRRVIPFSFCLSDSVFLLCLNPCKPVNRITHLCLELLSSEHLKKHMTNLSSLTHWK